MVPVGAASNLQLARVDCHVIDWHMKGTGAGWKTCKDLTGSCRPSVSEHVAQSLDTAGLISKDGEWGVQNSPELGPAAAGARLQHFAGPRMLLSASRTLHLFLPGCTPCGGWGLGEPGPVQGIPPGSGEPQIAAGTPPCHHEGLASTVYTWMPPSIPRA